MIDIDIQTIVGLTDDLPVSTDPMYQVAALSLMIRKNIEAMDTGGLSIQKPEITDFTAYSTSLSTWLDNAYDRETEIIKTGVASTAAVLPDVLSIGAAYVSGGATAAIGMMVKIALARVMGDSGAEGYRYSAGSSPDLSAIVSALESIATNVDVLAEEAVTFQGNFTEFGLNGDVSRLIDGILAIREMFQTININVLKDDDSPEYSAGPNSYYSGA